MSAMMNRMKIGCLVLALLCLSAVPVRLGLEVLLVELQAVPFQGKKVGLITNQTGVDSLGRSTIDLFKARHEEFKLVALFAPEHGIRGNIAAEREVDNAQDDDGIPIYSLYGKTRRPTSAMLRDIDALVFDIQDIGVRCYTYASTLFYCMEEAAKRGIAVYVLDRPNPINGITVDGPMLQPMWRSFVGYLDVPFCHGMTIGELARFFNVEYNIGCELHVVPMRGWKRTMSFRDTGLVWIPTSPQIPEPDTPLYYPITGILGEAQTGLSIGIGYTLPFKVVGAPWIDANQLVQALNAQRLPGVRFYAWHFRPFFGRAAGKECGGVRIVVIDPALYRPVTTQFVLLGILKSLYPQQFAEGVPTKPQSCEMLSKVTGTEIVHNRLTSADYIGWELAGLDMERRTAFLEKRKAYLLYD